MFIIELCLLLITFAVAAIVAGIEALVGKETWFRISSYVIVSVIILTLYFGCQLFNKI